MKKSIRLISYLTYIAFMVGLTVSTTCIAQIKSIQFATEATYPPFEYVMPNGKIQGFDVDVMEALCKEIGATCTIVNQPFDSLIPSLKAGKFDALIGAIAITKEREKQVDFTKPYYTNTVTFVAARTLKLTISSTDLKGKTIGVQSGTTFERYLEDTYSNIVKIKLYASNEQGLLDLKNGRIDSYFCDTPFIVQWLKKGNSKNFEIVGKPLTSQQYFGIGNGIAVKKGNKKLQQALNKALSKIKTNQTLNKIEQNYFGSEK